jgi:hypothetical protein
VIHALANGELLKIESVTNILLDEAFTFMSYELDLKLQESVKIDANH